MRLRKELMRLLPEGLLINRQWLGKFGFKSHAIDNMIKSEDLTALTPGIYYRGHPPKTWQSIVFTLQNILKLDLTVGGLTALEIEGMHHYLSMSSKKTVHLFGRDRIPEWITFSKFQFVGHSKTQLFSPAVHKKKSFTLTRSWQEDAEKQITISQPARALLEVMLDVPLNVTVEHAKNLMEQATSFSPESVQQLLEACKNVKAKRLFLWLAEKQNYPWFKRLDLNRIDLGSGKRVIVKGGKLDKKYLITVPQEYE